MAGTDNIIDFLESGLKAEFLRHKTIANNLANLRTPGYRTIDVKFKELLAKAMESSGEVDFNEIGPELYHPGSTPVKFNGNDVSLDAEVGKMVENSLRHATYIRLLHNKYNQIQLAINVS